MKASRLVMLGLLALSLSGCLGAAEKGADVAPTSTVPTIDDAKPHKMYIVATDFGSPFSEGIYKLRPAAFPPAGEPKIQVGDTINVTIKNAVGNNNEHNLIIPELGISLPAVKASMAASKEFNATKTGTFAYYCSIGNHRTLGMEGKLTIG
jgi:PBP1b-binding outer membrane lipoprotein LpoB